ncbi:hypothetical protein K458DRAFT_402855 [Lentithecium fluviatile CBS 122367]|uniref:Uncharacterized protein n=1 Tax=Lentithecium fluviatile CBS 122367 TaxID=1168545 RepID=A0A6G1J876_9PLEO|nr:hypothetical protein K458DRAFT_402855 [Lentithecium fluviatile CBS 122367]
MPRALPNRMEIEVMAEEAWGVEEAMPDYSTPSYCAGSASSSPLSTATAHNLLMQLRHYIIEIMAFTFDADFANLNWALGQTASSTSSPTSILTADERANILALVTLINEHKPKCAPMTEKPSPTQSSAHTLHTSAMQASAPSPSSRNRSPTSTTYSSVWRSSAPPDENVRVVLGNAMDVYQKEVLSITHVYHSGYIVYEESWERLKEAFIPKDEEERIKAERADRERKEADDEIKRNVRRFSGRR